MFALQRFLVALQELGYPEFCAALVRIADARFPSTAGLDKRVQTLVMSHLMPLLDNSRPTAMQHLLASPEFAHYLQTIRPILRILFCMLASNIQVRTLSRDIHKYGPSVLSMWGASDTVAARRPEIGPQFIFSQGGSSNGAADTRLQ
jgi:hypothetical protein